MFEIGEVEFKKELGQLTNPQGIFVNAGRIYDFLSELFRQDCNDSLLREWAFQWYSARTGDDYDNIYNKWLLEDI